MHTIITTLVAIIDVLI